MTAVSTQARLAGVYGPYAIYERCWVAGNNGQQAGQWQSFFCLQNGTGQWWLLHKAGRMRAVDRETARQALADGVAPAASAARTPPSA
ncbi:hypothetical protein [Streptomyces sp. CBMA152]|uniref:hypothetical protein n=1 Tax=Streptomyces sp. CBMA152 TaxID=1896312 RepID=UPI001660F140|nr:hypothetical protein [Streptomyces sp. CBMA152]